ncbi:hypothetical protein [Psychrobacillus sp. BM2]|uniref:hypothetical protein n=1 Tax=Psychrobacillus sp. BM2 TaxID=3400421 RepID=UPI003B010534
MDDLIGYVVVVFIILGISYGLVRQIKNTLNIRKVNKTSFSNYNKSLLSNYIACMSPLGFLISYIFNVLVGLQIIESKSITSVSTGISCFVFILVLIITKLFIISKNSNQHKLLNR